MATTRKPPRTLSVPERHQLRVARDTLQMSDVMVRVMGGPSKAEARAIVKRLTGKVPQENPAGQLWYPGGVGIGQDPQGNYMAIPIESTIGWDVVTLRSLFPEGFDAMKLGVFEARLGYEHSGQHGYHLFKVRVRGKWSRPMRLRERFTTLPGHDATRENPPGSLAFGGGSHKNTGTFIDGAFGEDHAVEVMKGLLQRVLRVADDADAQKLLDEVESVNDLDAEQAGEWLDDATDVLQRHTGGGLVWVWEAGDLVLMDETEAE